MDWQTYIQTQAARAMFNFKSNHSTRDQRHRSDDSARDTPFIQSPFRQAATMRRHEASLLKMSFDKTGLIQYFLSRQK